MFLKAQVIVLLCNEVFLINICAFFRHNAIEHNKLQYSVNITLIYTGKQKKESCVSLNCNIHFIAAI